MLRASAFAQARRRRKPRRGAAGLLLSASCAGFANSVSLLSRYVTPDGKVQALIQLAATAGSMTFPPAVALIAQRGVLGVRTAMRGAALLPVLTSRNHVSQVEAFLWVAAVCASVDILLVLLVQRTGARVLKARA